MPRLKDFLRSWGPALLMMILIFAASSRTANELPYFGWADMLVKKSGHMLAYGLLAAAYWRGLGLRAGRQPIAWVLVILYAGTDEFHQSFVPGRHPSVEDVLLFDNLGAVVGLIAYSLVRKKRNNRGMEDKSQCQDSKNAKS